ncbi:uncharacterized protein [Coffea arabica]|uniref:Uncharacterized protein n=1 Tax=Coffea arabica TaxID=13443 RepID=A0ABM4X5H7_COFAR
MEFLRTDMVSPWMAVGDFNVVSFTEQQVSGSTVNIRNVEEFNMAMFNCGLSSVEFERKPFTWANGSMWQQLDRALVNARWMDCCPIMKVIHLACECSDHSPLLIMCKDNRVRSSSFRFLNVWSSHHQFMGVVVDEWKKAISGVGMVGFAQKLKLV